MSVYIIRRAWVDKQGEPQTRFLVRAQQGRYMPQIHLGTFKRERLAKARRDWALGELAAGRRPDPSSITAPRERGVSVAEALAAYIAVRVDVFPKTRRTYQARAAHLTDGLGHLEAAGLTVEAVQAWIQRSKRQPRTLQGDISLLACALDHAGVESNVARDRRLKRPKIRRREITLPTPKQVDALVAHLDPLHARLVRFLAASGLRISEACALEWRQVDQARLRVLVEHAKTAAGRRFVELGAEDLPLRNGEPDDGRVFPTTRNATGEALAKASDKAKVPRITPHTLRHLHASRMLHEGVLSPAQLAERLGHSSPQITLGVYSHIVPTDDAPHKSAS